MNIVITGASKGIGRAIAIKFASFGHQIAICARGEKGLLDLENELKVINPKIQIISQACDVADIKSLKLFTQKIKNHWDTIDILVNNAGIFIPGSIQTEQEGNLEQLMATNVYSAYHSTRELLPLLLKSPKAYIINLCSVASIKAYTNGGSYAITKAALLAFSSNLREELKTSNIKVTSVLPGPTYTDSWSSAGIPEERFMPAEDVAEIIYTVSQLSGQTVIEEILMRPQLGDI
jgi:short-subunit dehydrogenase